MECLIVKKDVDLGINRPATLPLEIVEFIILLIEVMMTEEMDIGLNDDVWASTFDSVYARTAEDIASADAVKMDPCGATSRRAEKD